MYCNQTCLYENCNTCFRGDGECETCDIGLYGSKCSFECSDKCAVNTFNQITCGKNTGFCDEESCLPGYWNRPCDVQCNKNCRADSAGDRTCSYIKGVCNNGCEATYYGEQCNLNCSVTCINKLCERDGKCSQGCVSGTYGQFCQFPCNDTCNNGKCDQVSGICEECTKPPEAQTELCRTAGKFVHIVLFYVV